MSLFWKIPFQRAVNGIKVSSLTPLSPAASNRHPWGTLSGWLHQLTCKSCPVDCVKHENKQSHIKRVYVLPVRSRRNSCSTRCPSLCHLQRQTIVRVRGVNTHDTQTRKHAFAHAHPRHTRTQRPGSIGCLRPQLNSSLKPSHNPIAASASIYCPRRLSHTTTRYHTPSRGCTRRQNKQTLSSSFFVMGVLLSHWGIVLSLSFILSSLWLGEGMSCSWEVRISVIFVNVLLDVQYELRGESEIYNSM